MLKKIVFTGGGSAGHVTANIALIERLQEKYDLYYIGSNGLEKGLIAPYRLPYSTISPPKFIRGISLKNLTIPHRFFIAVREAKKALKTISPDLVFSKGGYVALPVVVAAWRLKIPVFIHESDVTLGLANRLSLPFCHTLLTSFPTTAKNVKKKIYVGSPVRESIHKSDENNPYNFANDKPTLLILGGGSGSKAINDAVRRNLFFLSERYNILHLCGKGNTVANNVSNYRQIEFCQDMGNAYAACNGVVCRAGANTVFEVLSLQKPALFIPLANKRSRGDQVKNADYFLKRGLCHVLPEGELSALPAAIQKLFADEQLRFRLKRLNLTNSTTAVTRLIEQTLGS